ncbi:MAG: BREX system P-loop protein BrxC [Megasphaera sp.]|jgi:hypothetical protein|nr:BREX system P-loop protein BrxC [Megasphaera sp.]
MKIKEMFAKPIDREIQGVIIVGQDESANVQQELEEYVVTKELQKHFADFFAAYRKGIVGQTPKMGVWISGFFGSGKSHFLKILSYLLANKEVNGKYAIDYFKDDKKIIDSMVMADMQLAADTPTDAVLFNIDSKSDSTGKQNKDAIVNVFLKVFNEMQGFCSSIPVLADLERQLTDKNRYREFKEKFIEAYGEPWEESRQDFDYIQDTVVEVLADMDYMSEAAARNWCERAFNPYSISIEEFAKRVGKYIEQKGNNHHVVFLVDEVGQYIGDNSQLMLNMQTVTEELGKECQGKAWVIVTSQQDIDSVTKVKGRDFSKIQGRFDTRISLSSADVDAVIKKRILEKKETPAQTLRLLYGQKETIIKNLIFFNDSVEKKLYANEKDFAEVYPFIPYQFNLLGSVLTSVRTHGASGKHLSEGERSMLAMFKESAEEYMNNEEGTLIPFYAFYDAMENFLDHSHRGAILKALQNDKINPDHKENVFAVNVLKTLFMIKYCNDICNATIENIASLMITYIDEDRTDLKSRVEAALKVLLQQMYVQKNGDIYEFLTNEEQEINQEINSQNVESAIVINKISEMIFEEILKDKKYHYPAFNGRYAFAFNQIVDEYPYKANQKYDIGVHIVTPAFSADMTDQYLRMMSGQQQEVLVVLPNNRTFMDEIQTYLKIEIFLQRNTSSGLSKYETIKTSKRQEMRERRENAKLYLIESLKTANIYVNADKASIGEKDVNARINEALRHLVQIVYHKLSYIDTAMSEDSLRKVLCSHTEDTLGLEGGGEANEHALNDVLQYVAGNTRSHMKTSMKTIKDRFMKAPYGFVEDDVDWLVARLFKRGDLAFTVNGAAVTVVNKTPDEIADYITKKVNVEKLLMEQRVHVSEKNKNTVATIMKVLFQRTSISEEEDSLMGSFMKSCGTMMNELKNLEIRYEGHRYPGKKVIQEGRALLQDILQIQSAHEFFQVVSKRQDEFEDLAEDYEPVKNFFEGEQKKIFDSALKQMAIYEDSKTYIVDSKLEAIVQHIQHILKMPQPYGNIPKLPELLDEFGTAYVKLLDEQQVPVSAKIQDARQRVFEELNTKEYKKEKQESYNKQFLELEEGANYCNNISQLRSFGDKAEALKIRLLDEMGKRDVIIKQQKLMQQKEEQKVITPGTVATPPATPYKTRTMRHVPIKKMTQASSWRLESKEDVDTYVEALRARLLKELDEDTIINIEF